MWVQSLGQEAPLEEGMATHSSIFAWRIPMNRGDKWATVHGATVHVQSMRYSCVRVRHDRSDLAAVAAAAAALTKQEISHLRILCGICCFRVYVSSGETW